MCVSFSSKENWHFINCHQNLFNGAMPTQLLNVCGLSPVWQLLAPWMVASAHAFPRQELLRAAHMFLLRGSSQLRDGAMCVLHLLCTAASGGSLPLCLPKKPAQFVEEPCSGCESAAHGKGGSQQGWVVPEQS